MKILFIEDDLNVGELVRPLLETTFNADVDEIRSIQAAIELLEGPWEPADLVVCDYHGSSTALMKCVIALCQGIPCIFVLDEKMTLESLKLPATTKNVEMISRQFFSKELLGKIKDFETQGKIKSTKKAELDAAKQAELNTQRGRLEQILANQNAKPAESRKAVEETLEIIHDVTEKMGFTPEVRALATKNVELSTA